MRRRDIECVDKYNQFHYANDLNVSISLSIMVNHTANKLKFEDRHLRKKVCSWRWRRTASGRCQRRPAPGTVGMHHQWKDEGSNGAEVVTVEAEVDCISVCCLPYRIEGGAIVVIVGFRPEI